MTQGVVEDFSVTDTDDTRTERSQEEIRKTYLTDLYEALKLPAGARVFCAILDEKLGLSRDAWSEKNARMARNTALKDVAEALMDDVAAADGDLYDDIQRMRRSLRVAEIMPLTKT
jgi:hypothetical protein